MSDDRNFMGNFLLTSTFFHIIGDFWADVVNHTILIVLMMGFGYSLYNDHYSLVTSWILTGLTITGVLFLEMVYIWFNKERILESENMDRQFINDTFNNRN